MVKTILVLAANPQDTPRLRLDEEVREIDNGLQRAQRRDGFILQQKWATRPADVRRAMLDLKPNIVHFCGHGGGENGIAFEDETGQTQLVSAEALAGFFELFVDEVECVVLNACYSEAQAEAIAQHIDYVIGMGESIEDVAAIEFAVAFYDALGAGESIEFAYKLACNAIQWAAPGHLTPILKSKPLDKRSSSDSKTQGEALSKIPTSAVNNENYPQVIIRSLVSSGSPDDLDRHRKPYQYSLPLGQTPNDIVGMGIAGSNDHVYVWFRDGTVSSGSSDELDKHRKPYRYSLPPGRTPCDIVGMGIAGSNDHVYVWFRDGTVSSGSSDNLDRYRKPYRSSLPVGLGLAWDDIVGMAIAGSNDRTYVWYLVPGS